METWNVIGYRHTEFDTQDGKHISGTKLYLTRDLSSGVGQECYSLFATARVMDCPETEIPIGGKATISYNRFGKPDCITFEEVA